jgi:tripartite ATP-independent transporter DctP family solute receptor
VRAGFQSAGHALRRAVRRHSKLGIAGGLVRTTILIVISIFMLAACSGSGPDTQQWRFALEEIEGSVQHAYATQFKELIEERTDGAVEVVIYPYGALGTSAQLTEQVQNGTLQFAFASPGHLGSVVPESSVVTIHFLFSDDAAVNQKILAESPTVYGPLAQAFEERGLKLLALVQEGAMAWTANRALRKPSDFRGFKMRTMVSPMLLATYRAYGANPTPMPYSEVYSGLQLNTIDGQDNPVFAIEEMSFYEVQSHLIFANHAPFIASLVANPAFYDSLDGETRDILDAVKQEMDDYIFEVQARFERERLDKLRSNSDIEIVELTEEERAAFRKASGPARDVFREQAGERGAQILESLVREIRAAESTSG